MTIQEFIQQNIPDYDKRSTDIALRVEKILNSKLTSVQKMNRVSDIYDVLFNEAFEEYRDNLIAPYRCTE